MTPNMNELWDDIELQLDLAEAQFLDTGRTEYYKLPGFPRIRLSYENGNDVLTVADSNGAQQEWRPRIEAISIQRREVLGIGEEFSLISLQVRFSSDERKRLVPFFTDITQLVHSGCQTDEAFEAVLEDWKDRFRAIRLPLNAEKQRGLFGELCVLRELINQSGVQMVGTWVGPDRSLHDFVDEEWHIEVKTSTTNPGRLKIHPLDQLRPISEEFYLLMVEITKGDGQSLPSLVNEIQELIANSPGPLDHYEKMLAKEGYRDSDADGYEAQYALDGFFSLQITEDTPVLHEIRIDPEVACIHSLRWTLKTEVLDFQDIEDGFWTLFSR